VHAIVHSGAALDVDPSPVSAGLMRPVDIDGTRLVVDAAVDVGVRRFVHTSSTATIGADDDPLRQWTEDAAPLTGFRAMEAVRRKTLETESLVRAAVVRGLDAIILNPAEILGGWDHEVRGWGRMVIDVAAGKVPPVPPGTGSFGAASEIGRAHVAALTQGSVGSRYILGGADTTYADLYTAIARATGVVPAVIDEFDKTEASGGSGVAAPSGLESERTRATAHRARLLAGHYRFDSSRAVRELDYKVVPLGSMVQQAYDWYRAHGFIAARAPHSSR
jgi:dihydroflavonol-4-reductase